MQKLFLLLLLFVSYYCVYIRPTNYDKVLLNECLGYIRFDENMEELLDLYNHNRFFLFGLKCEEMNLDESTINLLKDCFSKFGIYEPKAGCPDCYDKCEYYEPNNILCKRNCPIC